MSAARYGITIPFDGVPLGEQLPLLRELEALGYTDFWTSEASSADAFSPLAAAAAVTSSVRLGTAIAPVFTRGPATLALSAASLAELAPGRFVLGLGASSPAIVAQWNGIPFERPLARVRDTVRFLRRALAGERVSERYETFSVDGFRLERVPAVPPPIVLAALRPRMLELAAEEADGAVAVWLSAEDAATVAPYLQGKEFVARILVCPSEDADAVRAAARRAIAVYLNVPAYAEYHRWLGRADALAPMWEASSSGDRRGAADLVPDAVVDELVVHGTPDECRRHVERYIENGVTTPVLAVQPWGTDPLDAARLLAPR